MRTSKQRTLHWVAYLLTGQLPVSAAIAEPARIPKNALFFQTGQATHDSPSSQIVTCRPETDIDILIRELQVIPTHIYRYALKGFAVRLNGTTVENLKKDRRVLAVELDGPVELCWQTIPPGVLRMGIDHFPVARLKGTGHPLNVDVAILDSGIDANHPDLNVFQVHSEIFGDGMDGTGHGTMVAGVLAAKDNGFGVVGVAPGIRLWNVQCVGVTTNGIWSNALAGMDYVSQHADQISVANLSFGNSGRVAYSAVRQAVQAMVNSGVVVVVAAGNSSQDLSGRDGIFGTSDDFVPAALPEAMCVSGMDPMTDTFSQFSNFSGVTRPNTLSMTNSVSSPGGAIDVAAPAVNIPTTGLNGTYVVASGTSFAAPHVAGLVALYIAANGRATNAEGVYAIRQAIINASLPQTQWHTNNTMDPDANPEPLAMPSETWIPLPRITAQNNTPAGFQLSFATVPGYDYTVQTTNLRGSPSEWTSLTTVSGAGSLSTITAIDPLPVTGRRLYRVVRQPSP